MAKISDITAGRFLSSEEVVDGTLVKLSHFESNTAFDPGKGVERDVETVIFAASDGKMKPMILNKTNAKKLGELGIIDTDDPVPDGFPALMLILVDTSFGQGIRIKEAPQGSLVDF